MHACGIRLCQKLSIRFVNKQRTRFSSSIFIWCCFSPAHQKFFLLTGSKVCIPWRSGHPEIVPTQLGELEHEVWFTLLQRNVPYKRVTLSCRTHNSYQLIQEMSLMTSSLPALWISLQVVVILVRAEKKSLRYFSAQYLSTVPDKNI